jgi:Protein of unknown function (DUF4235)
MAEKEEKEDIGTRVVYAAATMGAAFAARKVLIAAWTKATGKKPPTNPEDPRVALAEALSWSVLVGITVAVVRVIAIRVVARNTTQSNADDEVAGVAKS